MNSKLPTSTFNKLNQWLRMIVVLSMLLGSLSPLMQPAVAAAANLAWGWALGISPPIVWARLAGALRATLGQLGQVLRQAIGSFGWLDTPMPTFSHVFWLALVLALAALAMVGGERRQRRVLIGSLAVCVSITLALGVLLAQHDQAVAGRYVLPVVIVLPMLAGEVVANSRGWAATERLRRGVLAATIAVAAVHVLAWLVNARRHAVGTEGPLQFLTNDVWSPLGGWWPWLLAAVAAAFLQAWSAVLLGSTSSGRRAGLPAGSRLRRVTGGGYP